CLRVGRELPPWSERSRTCVVYQVDNDIEIDSTIEQAHCRRDRGPRSEKPSACSREMPADDVLQVLLTTGRRLGLRRGGRPRQQICERMVAGEQLLAEVPVPGGVAIAPERVEL